MLRLRWQQGFPESWWNRTFLLGSQIWLRDSSVLKIVSIPVTGHDSCCLWVVGAIDIWFQNQTPRMSVVSISLCLSWSFCLLLLNVISFSFFSPIYNLFSPLILLCTNPSCHFHSISLFSFFLIFHSPSHAYFLSSATSPYPQILQFLGMCCASTNFPRFSSSSTPILEPF